MNVRPLNHETDMAQWLQMRMTLYEGDESETADYLAEMDELIATPEENGIFVVDRGDGRLAGFVEVGIRKYAEGCTTSPVAYLEGWFVAEDARRQGVGRELVEAAESWAVNHGYTEMASDALLDNTTSHAAHTALGFREVERHVCYIKKL